MRLSNETTRLELDERGNLLSLCREGSTRNYIAEGGCELFRLTLSETYEGEVLPGLLRLTPETAQEVTAKEEESRLTVTFRQLDGLDLDVTAEITLEGDCTYWRLRVANNTAFAVKEIEYPWFLFRTPLGDAPETERILLPKMDGVLLGNPALHPWNKNEKGVQHERYWYPGEGRQWPWNLAVQLTAYYDRDEGLLLYTADPEGHPKKIGPIVKDGQTLDFSPVHLRPEVGGLDFELEYPVVTRFFTGDWQAAADCYREWAETAPWCRKTVAEREDIPDWIRKGAFFLNFRLRYQKDGEAFLDRVPAFVRAWKEKLKIPMVAMMCGWEKVGEWAAPDYFPLYGGKERFARMCAELKKDGTRPFTFGLSGVKLLVRRHQPKSGAEPQLGIDYDARKKFREEWVHSAATDPNGVPYMDSDLDGWDGVHAYACPATAQAMDQLCGASVRLQKEYGVALQQADQVLGGGTPCCYNTAHGHTPGWGVWQANAVKKIYTETRKQGKALDPEFALSEEWICEQFIPYLDLYHCRNYDKPQGGLESVPIFSYLYHHYLPSYGGDWTSFMPENKTGVHFHGWNFVVGNLPAGAPIDMLREYENHLPEDADPATLEMAAHSCAQFVKSARFLVGGRMLRTEPLDVPTIRIKIDGLDFGQERRETDVPVVLHEFWEAPDGERACALANIVSEPQTVRIPVGRYSEKTTVFVERNGADGREELPVVNGEAVLTLAPRDAVTVLL